MDTENPTPEALYFYRFIQGGLTQSEAATLAGVCPRTLKRWERGQSRINRAAFRLFKLHAAGIRQSGPWRGWNITEEKLHTPEGTTISVGEIRALPYLLALIASLRNGSR